MPKHAGEPFAHLADPERARIFIEQSKWPYDIICPNCDRAAVTPIKTRKGLYQCRLCRKQFNALKGTIFEGSHIPLNIWLLALFEYRRFGEVPTVDELRCFYPMTYKTALRMHRKLHEHTKKLAAQKQAHERAIAEVRSKPKIKHARKDPDIIEPLSSPAVPSKKNSEEMDI